MYKKGFIIAIVILLPLILLTIVILPISINPEYNLSPPPLVMLKITQGNASDSLLVPYGTKLNELINFKPGSSAFCSNDYNCQISGDYLIKNDMDIFIKQEEQRYSLKTTEIPFKNKRTYDYENLTWGEADIVAGKVGEAQQLWQQTFINDALIKEELIFNKTIIEPVAQQTIIGRKKVYLDIDYSKAQALEVEATAYTDTITATGIKPYKGVIAVDPRVIPLYSRVYVPGYGMTTALDVGGAVKGNIIDLFFEDNSEAWKFGRQKMTVYIIN